MTNRPPPSRAALTWRATELCVERTVVGGIDIVVQTPRGTRRTDPTPVLLVHDGPYYARHAGLTRTIGEAIAAGRVPPVRLALMEPGPRFARYSASVEHSMALVDSVLPHLAAEFACNGKALVMGASLGGLSALHAEWSHPGTFAGVFAQSGSFFTRRDSPGDDGFVFYRQVLELTGAIHRARRARTRAHIVLTCGHEGNLAANRSLAAALQRAGADATLYEIPGGHTWASWRGGVQRHLVAWLAASLTVDP